jgi:hypothetical protein
MTDADDAVLSAVEKTILNAAVVERAIALAESELIDDGAARRRAPLVVDLEALDADVGRLTTAIKRGGDLDPLLAALRECEARRGELRQRIAALDAAPRTAPLDADAVRAKLRSYVADYRKLLLGHVPQAQQILRRLVVGKLTFTPKLNGDYEFAGKGTVRPLLSGVIRKLASPSTPSWNQITTWLRSFADLRNAGIPAA